jgi:hypothetical protein
MPDIVRAILLEKTKFWAQKIADRVEDNIQSRLKSKSGRLAKGVKVELTTEGLKVNGRVFIQGAPHALAQEEGAIVPPHMIFPKSGRTLAFIGATGDKVFATKVSHPGGTIPGQHFMKDAYREFGPKISRDMKKGIVEGIRAKMRGR